MDGSSELEMMEMMVEVMDEAGGVLRVYVMALACWATSTRLLMWDVRQCAA